MSMNDGIGAYAVARIEDVRMGPEIAEYLERIEATLEPFGGRYVVHGSRAETLEGEWRGDLVIIGFPDRVRAEAWYASDGYQAILPLRAANSDSTVVLIDGVKPGHRTTDVLGGGRAAGRRSDAQPRELELRELHLDGARDRVGIAQALSPMLTGAV